MALSAALQQLQRLLDELAEDAGGGGGGARVDATRSAADLSAVVVNEIEQVEAGKGNKARHSG